MTWDTESTKASVEYALLVEVALTSNPIRVHSGVGPLTWNGYEWLGVGQFGDIAAIGGASDLEAQALEMTLSGIPTDYRSELLNAGARGADVNIYHGFLNQALGSWAVQPQLIYAGFVSTAPLSDEIGEEGPSVSITLRVLSASARVRRGISALETDAHQRDLWSDDAFFSFVSDLRIPQDSPGAAGNSLPAAGAGGRLDVINADFF